MRKPPARSWVLGQARGRQPGTRDGRVGQGIVGSVLPAPERRRRAEESQRESEQRYRNVVETQTELICRYLPDSTLTFVNDAYCRYFGRSRDELVGSPFVGLIPEAERAAARQHIEAIGRSARGGTFEHRVIRPDGSVGWQQWTDHAIRDAAGMVVELQSIGRDVTDLKIADLEVEQRRKEVTHLTRVAILGELSGALAHELNQPLTAILSNAQAAQRLLARAPLDPTVVGEILADIVTDDLRAGEVIARLRALLKKGEASVQPLSLNEVATEVLALARGELIERHVTVSTRLAPGLPSILGDRVMAPTAGTAVDTATPTMPVRAHRAAIEKVLSSSIAAFFSDFARRRCVVSGGTLVGGKQRQRQLVEQLGDR